ncbi:hypothetical protein C8R45DRAFT_944426 [Mycena sanguinolenta]|nr:hypothetical protein C8R45DRAFT_944426 [Mycena sanguinolenta]
MTKDACMTAQQWVACEKFHEALLAWVDRTDDFPGEEPVGYGIYCTYVKKARVSDFPNTEKLWKSESASDRATTGSDINWAEETASKSMPAPVSAGAQVQMTTDALTVLANMPNVMARTAGDLMMMASNAYRPAPMPRFPFLRGKIPRYGISARTVPMMGRPNRVQGGLIGEPELNVFEAACLPENAGRIGEGLNAKGWNKGRKDGRKEKKRRGRRGGKKAKGARVAAVAVAVAQDGAGPSTSAMEIEPKTEEVEIVMPAAVEDTTMDADDEYDKLFDENDELITPGWDGKAAVPMM